MAGPGALSKCMAVSVAERSITNARVLRTAACSPQLRSSHPCGVQASVHFHQGRFPGDLQRRSVQHSGMNLTHLTHQLAGDSNPSGLHFRHAVFICRAAEGVVDQNERLKDAAKAGDLDAVNDALGMSEVDIDLVSSKRAGWAALHLATYYGHVPIVKLLLNAGADVDVRNGSGNTPLHLASLKGNINLARILLDSGANIYAEGADRGTPLDYAQEWGGEEIVDFLLLWAAKASLQAEAG